MGNAEITMAGLLSMQICVPKDWSDKKVTDFAEKWNPSGTTNGWMIRKQGDELLDGCDERTQCLDHQNKVHIMLDA